MSCRTGESGNSDHMGEVRNNNQNCQTVRGEDGEAVLPDGDANANQMIQTGDEGGDVTGDLGSLRSHPMVVSQMVEQDKVIIWGTDFQCDDPDLAEFEMLECQDLEAYLVEEEEEHDGVTPGKTAGGEGKILLDQPVSVVELVSNQSSGGERGGWNTIQQGSSEQEAPRMSHLSGSRAVGIEAVDCVVRTEFSSENDVFVSCLSTMSSLGGSLATLEIPGQTPAIITDSWHTPSGPKRTISDDLSLASQSCNIMPDCSLASQRTKKHQVPSMNTLRVAVQPQPESVSTTQRVECPCEPSENTTQQADHPFEQSESTTQRGDLDLNQNRTIRNEEFVIEEAQVSNRFKVGQCKSQLNMQVQVNEGHNHHLEQRYREVGDYAQGNRRLLPPDVNHNSPAKSDFKGIQSVDSKGFKKQGSFDKTLNKQGSFEQKLKKTTSFEQNIKKNISFENTTKKSASFDRSLRKEPSFDRTLRKQGSFEHSSSPSSLEGRKPWGSPSRSPSRPAIPPWSPRRQAPNSPAKTSSRLTSSPSKTSNLVSSQDQSGSPQRAITSCLRMPSKVCVSSNLPKTISPQPPAEPRMSSPSHKTKTARPKIITYVRKSPQVQLKTQSQEIQLSQAETSAVPPRLPASNPSPPTAQREPHKAGPRSKASQVLCSSNALFDKYRQEMQKAGFFPPGTGMTSLGIKPPTHPPPQRLTEKSGSFHEELPIRHMSELGPAPPKLAPQEGIGLLRSPRPRGPQLGLGAVTRQPIAAKSRTVLQGQTGQRSGVTTHSNPGQPAKQGTSQGYHDHTANQRRPTAEYAQARIQLSKSGQSGLRPPGFSALPPARQATFGFVRNSSISSVSSNQSTASGHSDPCRPSQLCGSPTGHVGSSVRSQEDQCQRTLVEQLRERCEKQTRHLQTLQVELNKASLGLDVFAITTQHFYQKSERAFVKERELSFELTRIRDEVASSVLRWEALHQDKEALERRFEGELVGLRAQQQSDLAGLEEKLRQQNSLEVRRLKAEQEEELETLQTQYIEQMEDMTEDLKMAHEQQRKSLEEDFEKLRLSLQDQVDTLTFQNRSLRERAKRFEEALCRSTEEQIVEALAPYQHIEEDLKSLKEVLEMKNQQIHEQDIKISELEKMQAQKNVFLEERVQVLQHQNEELRARIDKNLALSRHLSEENANLQESVEKESNEKKRLSRNNEELLWRLQTGELSPHMSPTGSPIHRVSPILHGSTSSSPIHHRSSPCPPSPARPHSYHQ
ncbi:hypothetical protein UPYG_G00192350 [Umbra pygmaea]|uniref:Microtubule associated tumor suppressor candidate 2 n=1 Tax=Umbra pygmaea TaxID=75934 RepID=A0ABD0X4D0_UMBPY